MIVRGLCQYLAHRNYSGIREDFLPFWEVIFKKKEKKILVLFREVKSSKTNFVESKD